MTEAALLLALDIGTSNVKAGLFSSTGRLLRMALREQVMSFPAEGRVEQSPEQAWRLILECVREATERCDKDAIAGISTSSHRGTAIALDAEGNPLTEFILWMDRRGLPIVEWMRRDIGLEHYYATAGHPIVSITGVSKVLWIQRHASEAWERAAVVAPPQTYFLKRLGVEGLVCDRSSGTFFFPFDIGRREWSETLAERLGYPVEKLPTLVEATAIVGRLSASAASELDLPAGIALVPGGGDGQCAGAGSGTTSVGRVMVNIGTGASVQAFQPTPRRDPACTLNLGAHVVSGAWEMEGHTQASGAALRWFRDTLGTAELAIQRESGVDAYSLLITEAMTVPPGSDGLLVLPTFNGSTAPLVDLEARAGLLGLSLSHTRAHLIRAWLEGISIELRWVLDAMLDLGTPVREVRLVGGGSRDRRWNQIHADILGRPVTTVRCPEAAMTGAAMCAAIGTGACDGWGEATERFVQVDETIEPTSATQGVYADLYGRYREVFRLLHDGKAFRASCQAAPSSRDAPDGRGPSLADLTDSAEGAISS